MKYGISLTWVGVLKGSRLLSQVVVISYQMPRHELRVKAFD